MLSSQKKHPQSEYGMTTTLQLMTETVILKIKKSPKNYF
jgi:hypothetical protein